MKRWAWLVATAGLLAACGGANRDAGGLTGVVEGDGSSTVAPISQAIAEEFLIVNPRVQVPIGTSGTGGGFDKFCSDGPDATDFNDASRPIKDEEARACAKAGVDFVELQVAVDGLTVVVHSSNEFAQCLTVEELNTIWGPQAEGRITTWDQVRQGFPNEPLKLYGPGADSGTFDYFSEAINGEEGAQRTDYGNVSEDDNQALRAVQQSPGAMAYFGYAFYVNNTDKVKAVAIDDGDGCVAPTEETITSGAYAPLSRPLLVYVNLESLERPEVAAYMQFYLDIVNELIVDVGYVRMDEGTLAAQTSKLRAAIRGDP